MTAASSPSSGSSGAADLSSSKASQVLEAAFQRLIAQEVNCRPAQVAAAADLFAEGNTVPFVARYRKEATGGLEDEQLESIAKRREYFLELMQRRDAILASIEEQGKLTPELEAAIRAAVTKQELEDLYLPYKRKRRTRAQIARERGLEPLADALLVGAAEGADARQLAQGYVDGEKEVADEDGALAGARDILAERLAEQAEHRADLRKTFVEEGVLAVRALTGKEESEEAQVFRDYFDYSEPAAQIASHRLLAVLRGEREGVLLSDLEIDDESEVFGLAGSWGVPLGTSCGLEVRAATEDGYRRLLRPSIANQVRTELRQKAEDEAISVFRDNLEALLLQSPLGERIVIGLDPGYRTGCKAAVVDPTGRVLATEVIYPVPPRSDEARAARVLLDWVQRYGATAVAVGNGTGSRETEVFAKKALTEAKVEDVMVVIVPETGASVYSASAVAREELPELDVSLRGAVSIARRLQDPLAELVKIEPKSLGVGQYQHDVDQRSLARELDLAVETAVNRVGVELNTASASLLRRVAGLSDRVAKAIVDHRDAHGPFGSRRSLLAVAGLGAKTFEQSAGFLRVRAGEHPLDRTGVHPERYGVVEKMAKMLQEPLDRLVGNPALVARIDFEGFANDGDGLGSFTLGDIRSELEAPGRDPRPTFRAPAWRQDVTSVDDLQPNMVLEGRVTNVTNFGAFVDLGVKRDGLVHLSEMSNEWVDDPREVVKVGDIVKVKVMEVDRPRQRINLSMRLLQKAPDHPGPRRPPRARDQESSGERSGSKQRHQGRAAAKPGPRRPPRKSPQGPPAASRGARKGPASVEDLMAKFNRRPPGKS
ncbi:MAG: Tex family protein [Acidobacteriota bacterium]